MEAQIAVMRAELEAEASELEVASSEERERTRRTSEDEARLGATRSTGRAAANGERR